MSPPTPTCTLLLIPVMCAVATGGSTDFTVSACNVPDCTVAQMITDSAGNTFITGTRTTPSPTSPDGGNSDAYVAKLDSAGATVFVTTFTREASERGNAIAVDASGNILVGGLTRSTNFPVMNAVQRQPGAGSTGFLLKLSPDGSRVLFSTYFGGTSGWSSVDAVAFDYAGNAYVSGQTVSGDFRVTSGMPNGPVMNTPSDTIVATFIAKLTPAGDKVLYSGLISGRAPIRSGGSSCMFQQRTTSVAGIAVDAAGNAYVGGNTAASDLPSTKGALVSRGFGAWVARINAFGSKLDYLTYLGATQYGSQPYARAATVLSGLTADAAGYVYLAGWTNDPQLFTRGGSSQRVLNGPAAPVGMPPPTDAFVAKLNPQGTALIYGTFLGGAAADTASAIAVDSSGSVYVTGTTVSPDFPVTTEASNGREFLAVLNSSGSTLSFSTRLPSGSTSLIASSDVGRVLMASPTAVISSLALSGLPSTRVFGIRSAAGGAPGPAVSPGEVVTLSGTRLGPIVPAMGQADSSARLQTTLGGTQVLFDGVPVALLYVSEDQIQVVAPFGLVSGRKTAVRILAGLSQSPEFRSLIFPARPRIFRDGEAIARNEDGSPNSVSNPAPVDSVLAIWATGVGRFISPPVDGQVASGAREYFCCDVFVSDTPVEAVYQGSAPGMVTGVVQLNFRVPVAFSNEWSVLSLPVRIGVRSSAGEILSPRDARIWVRPYLRR